MRKRFHFTGMRLLFLCAVFIGGFVVILLFETSSSSNDITFGGNLKSVLFIILSGRNNEERLFWQNRAWTKYTNHVVYTEDSFNGELEKCVVCKPHPNNTQYIWDITKSSHYFEEHTPAWWCAQKRYLMSVKHAFKYFKADKSRFSWFFIVEDDTYINTHKLEEFVRSEDPTIPKFFASSLSFNVDRRIPYPASYSGPGYLFSKPAMITLISDGILDSCIERVQGGDWCWWHYSWSMSACAAQAGLIRILRNDMKSVNLGEFFDLCSKPDVLSCHTYGERVHPI